MDTDIPVELLITVNASSRPPVSREGYPSFEDDSHRFTEIPDNDNQLALAVANTPHHRQRPFSVDSPPYNNATLPSSHGVAHLAGYSGYQQQRGTPMRGPTWPLLGGVPEPSLRHMEEVPDDDASARSVPVGKKDKKRRGVVSKVKSLFKRGASSESQTDAPALTAYSTPESHHALAAAGMPVFDQALSPAKRLSKPGDLDSVSGALGLSSLSNTFSPR
ncbi:hypothetical protein EIP91_007858 [Steccherinum ochraceum]|uniref:Uncharacterized protein n=1 Tax=Steccherinum ochraceum TaxID=92696 RepID=A0A4R0RBW5_9APHY|nr:hypothetical protein EIP91_007858 [Steccherinum ochraceum]